MSLWNAYAIRTILSRETKKKLEYVQIIEINGRNIAKIFEIPC